MSSEEIENKINETRNKITVETKLFLGLLNMFKMLKDKHALQQCENQIQEQTERLKFLKTELDKLIKNKEQMEKDSKANSEDQLSENENMVAFDFLHNQSSLTTEKIAYRMRKIHKKLLVENKFKVGAEKAMEIMNTTNVPESSNQYIEAKTKVKENEYKILCLNNALKRYKGLYLGPPIDFDAEDKANEQKNSTENSNKNMTSEQKLVKVLSCLHPSQNGTLQIKIVSASKLSTLSGDMDLKAIVSVNGHQFATTSSNKFGKWNEYFELNADKDAEIEVMVKENSTSVVGLVWFKPSELKEAEKLKKLAVNDEENSKLYTLSLEPAGEIQLKMNYVYDKKQNVQSGIQRRKAAHKLILNKQGHKLVSNPSIFKCAACGEFILNGSGLQCVECRYVCHNRCAPMIIAKCITKGTNDHNEDKDSVNIFISNYNIPHRFKPGTNLTGAWCCHCGLMLPLGKNQISKCSECGKTCHNECKVLLPNLCGMSNEMAKSFMSAIEKAEQEKRIKTVEALRKHHTILVASSSNKAPKKKIKPPTLDDFHFITVLGRGSFGKVMLAEEKTSKKLFAIKMLKKQYIVEKDEVHSMMSEKSVFLTVSSINHPFLVNLHSCFSSASRIYFVMEYAQGGDLIYHVRQNNFTHNRAKFYLCEVLLALEYLHKKNIIYRDLKLDNILLTVDGHIKITDYGLCKENMDVSTTTTTFCGTPEFMAPELLKGQPYTRAVDWWTFGILTYEMLVRGAPFKGNDDEELFRNIIEQQPFYPQHMGRDAIQLTSLLLMKDPRKRLGASQADAQEVKNHAYFKGVDWQAMLEKRVPVPYVPKFKGKLDVSHFDEEFTNEPIKLSPIQNTLKPNEQELFRGFTYVNPSMSEDNANSSE
ncbi:kinase-like protein [Anaeromyces robustus]|jgi:serine/threonine protein kinase|uniref:protein kinase C n=1 Tax=Anaeromyces robustus TaxID=1754192 RepID=A0A1Y1WPE0_9FUNG|nr:kinase-like protein [Anaeromyces robustus]|eukprot:ORX75126.1 kinase-like protein [Anaeromyces robustus]